MKYFIAIIILIIAACSDDKPNTAVDKIGIGGECVESADCITDTLTCLVEFKNGYCGLQGCAKNEECPELWD